MPANLISPITGGNLISPIVGNNLVAPISGPAEANPAANAVAPTVMPVIAPPVAPAASIIDSIKPPVVKAVEEMAPPVIPKISLPETALTFDESASDFEITVDFSSPTTLVVKYTIVVEVFEADGTTTRSDPRIANGAQTSSYERSVEAGKDLDHFLLFDDLPFDPNTLRNNDVVIKVHLANPVNCVFEVDNVVVTLTDTEVMVAGDSGAVMSGNYTDESIAGGAGNDDINAYGGDNSVLGGGGDDVITAGVGNDLDGTTPVVAGDNTINGGTGDDTISTGAGDDLIDGGAGRDRLLGGIGGVLPLHGGLHGHHGHDPHGFDGRALEVEFLHRLGHLLRRRLLPALRGVDLGRRLRLLGVRVGKLAKAGSPEAQGLPYPAMAPAARLRAAEAGGPPVTGPATLDLFPGA